MERADGCEREIERDKATVECPRGFRCCRQCGSRDTPPAKVYRGANIVQCQEADRMDCQVSPAFSGDVVFCRCPLRRYLAMEREERPKTGGAAQD